MPMVYQSPAPLFLPAKDMIGQNRNGGYAIQRYPKYDTRGLMGPKLQSTKLVNPQKGIWISRNGESNCLRKDQLGFTYPKLGTWQRKSGVEGALGLAWTGWEISSESGRKSRCDIECALPLSRMQPFWNQTQMPQFDSISRCLEDS